MTERQAGIPKRAAYKAAEVCEIAHIQPYVLRSWESEFPRLGVTRGAGVARIYRQTDLEQVLRIKQLVFEEGLTLAGARRRLEADSEPQPDLPLDEFVSSDVRHRIACVRDGLKDLLQMLGGETAAPSEARSMPAKATGDEIAPSGVAEAGDGGPSQREASQATKARGTSRATRKTEGRSPVARRAKRN